jgi:hypothetical protein
VSQSTINFENEATGLPTQVICGVNAGEHAFAITNRETDIETCFDRATAHALVNALAEGASSSSFAFRNRDDDPRGRFQISRSGGQTRLSVEVSGGRDPRSTEVILGPDALRRLRDTLARQFGLGD